MLSRSSRYALELLALLCEAGDVYQPRQALAERSSVPANYLGKLLGQLARAGFVDSRKGWGGGFRLAPEARERPLGDVLALFQRDLAEGLGHCALGRRACLPSSPCCLHATYSDARERYRRLLEESTLRVLS